MRSVRLAFTIVGAVLLLGAAAFGAIGLFGDDEPLRSTDAFMLAVGLGIAGLVLALVGRSLAGADPRSIRNGMPGSAQVLSVRDTGSTINHVNGVFIATVEVTVGHTPPYEANVKLVLNRSQWGAIQPGMTIPVLVDPNTPRKVVFDPARPVMAGRAPAAGAPDGAPVSSRVNRVSADTVIEHGVAAEATLHVVDETGLVAGQLAADLPAQQADDPLVKVVFTFAPTDGDERRSEALVRVPDGHDGRLRPGSTVPIRYLPNDPSVATIDWSRL